MKNVFMILMVGLFTSLNVKAGQTIEFGFGDYYTYKYTGEEYSGMLIAKAGEYNNAFFIGRGVKFDNLYLGMVVGLTDREKRDSGGLDFAAGVEASLKIPFNDKFSARIESVQTPRFQMDTILFGYTF